MEYQICNFKFLQENLKNLKIGEYYFEKVQDYEEIVEKKLYKPGATKWPLDSQGKIVKVPEQEGSHQVTCIATAEQEEKDSVLLLGGKGIKDILLLYNFFARRSSCVLEDKWKTDYRFDNVGISFGAEKGEEGETFELIETAFKTIHNINWLNENQESIFPFHWLIESRVPRIFEISYVLRWIAFNVLWKSENLGERFRYILNKYLDKNDEIPKLEIEFYKVFLANIRNLIIHRGNLSLDGYRQKLNDGRDGFEKRHKDFFNNKIKTEDDFLKFKCGSWYILDSLLSVFFARMFGIENVNNYIVGNQVEWIKNYFQSLKIPDLMGG